MIAFAALLERLAFTPAASARVVLLRHYCETAPDPDRGTGLALLTGGLAVATVRPALLRALAAARTDPLLFAWSHDYVGDLAETLALMWPATPATQDAPALAEVVQRLNTAAKAELPEIVAGWLDAAEAPIRLALLKLVTGGLRAGWLGAGVPARLVKAAVAAMSGGRIGVDDVEEVWHGLAPPYLALFAWAAGSGPRPDPAGAPVFRPPMLAHPLEPADLAALDPASLRAEWQWDGLRVQLAATPAGSRLFSREGEDISAAFPEIVAAMRFDAVLDGALLVVRDGVVAPFAGLQQRLNRRTVTAQRARAWPVAVRLFDLLFETGEDLRPLPFDRRRARLEAWHARTLPARMELSDMLPFASVAALEVLRAGAPAPGIAGLMLKRADSPYQSGRPHGLWWKWPRAPLTLDAVLMYAQRGPFGPEVTFGLWRPAAAGGEELVPVGKAGGGGTDAGPGFLDGWIRAHTVARFGPVREVEKSLVLEVAFDSAQASTRHRAGVTLRGGRIARIRTDQPAAAADRLATLLRMVEGHQ